MVAAGGGGILTRRTCLYPAAKGVVLPYESAIDLFRRKLRFNRHRY
jgi:hypothetical protein